jgi:microcystin-dependent protein
MSEPFLGEIRIVGFNFAPRGWARCDGQLLAIAQNTALFALLGTTYGGDGRTTFGLPDLRGRVPVHVGNGLGLSPRNWGEKGGSESNTLTANNLPPHRHDIPVTDGRRTTNRPEGAVPARGGSYSTDAPTGLAVGTGPTGTGQAVNNVQPYLAVYFVIALQGLFPSRS